MQGERDPSHERKVFRLLAEAALRPSCTRDVCHQVLDGMVTSMEFDFGTLRFYDENTEVLNLQAVVGLEMDSVSKTVRLDDKDHLGARVSRTKIPIFASDVSKMPELDARRDILDSLEVRSLIFWPIVGSLGDLLGVLNIASRSPKNLSDQDRGYFETVARMFAAVLERHRAIEALQSSEESYRLLAEASKDVIWTVDMNLQFTYLSPSITHLVGYTPEEALATPMTELMTPKSLKHIQDAMTEAIELESRFGKDGYDSPPLEVQMLKKDGSTVWVEISRTFLRDENDRPIGVLGVARDVTRRKFVEMELKREKGRAEFYNDLLAHDLANIQQGIMASLELLFEEAMPKHLERFVSSALSLTKRGVKLTSNVKKLAMLSREEAQLHKLNFGAQVSAAADMVLESFPEKRVDIRFHSASDNLYVMADEFLVDVFYNLLHNSVRLDNGSPVVVEIRASNPDERGLITIEVEDRGPGIRDALKESVFARIGEEERRGRGLGLTLVKQIIERYKGMIAIEDRVKDDYTQGTRFVISLPSAP
ncbi:MAG: PAS domain S-box protein [Candidatus Thorarchaeota archaeon]|nr:MAG: PAS domain S-box protein [Candidatus Thorarchaeota archaeon]